MAATEEWRKAASRLLRAEMVRRGIRYADLVERLRRMGARETEASLMNKVSRGTMPAALFLMAMRSMGVKSISIEEVGD